MRRTIRPVLGSVMLCIAASAQAADLRLRTLVEPVAPPAAFTWVGFYVGAQAGYSWGRDTTKEYFTPTMGYVGLKNTFKPDGFIGGLHAGANQQFGAIVVGIEGDVDFGKVRGGFVDPPAPPANPGGRGYTAIDLQGSIRGRLGYAFGPALLYATGGVAAARIESTYFNWPGVGETFKRTTVGYTAGGGVEYAFTRSLSARVEYRFTQFNLFENHSQIAFPGFSGTQEPHYHATRAGISYRF